MKASMSPTQTLNIKTTYVPRADMTEKEEADNLTLAQAKSFPGFVDTFRNSYLMSTEPLIKQAAAAGCTVVQGRKLKIYDPREEGFVMYETELERNTGSDYIILRTWMDAYVLGLTYNELAQLIGKGEVA